jgi:hypothetical protein
LGRLPAPTESKREEEAPGDPSKIKQLDRLIESEEALSPNYASTSKHLRKSNVLPLPQKLESPKVL